MITETGSVYGEPAIFHGQLILPCNANLIGGGGGVVGWCDGAG